VLLVDRVAVALDQHRALEVLGFLVKALQGALEIPTVQRMDQAVVEGVHQLLVLTAGLRAVLVVLD
jgi:hypothetical protein